VVLCVFPASLPILSALDVICVAGYNYSLEDAKEILGEVAEISSLFVHPFFFIFSVG